MSDLCCLVYVSTACHVPKESELENMLENARAFNQVMGITGVLLHSDGIFFQYIEGSCEKALDVVYEKIRASRLHHGLIELYRGSIDRRLFSDWLMGSTHVPEHTLTSLRFANWKILKDELFDKTKPETNGLLLLQYEWEQMRGFS